MRYRSLVVLALAGFPGYSAVLSAPGQSAGPGQVIPVAVTFSAEGQPVSGLQFDLEWDPGLDLKLVPGERLRGSSKLLFTASPSSHTVRCLVIGNNTDVLPDGILLQVFIVIDSQAAPGIAQVRVGNTLATSPGGDPVPFSPTSIAIEILSGTGISIALPAAGILNAASLLPGPVSPGEIVTLLGNLPEGSTVLFNGLPAPILYAGVNQVNAVVPFALDTNAPADLDIRTGERTSRIPVSTAPATPAIFTQTATGGGPGAILNEDYTPNSASNPAARNSVIMIYGTGFGTLDPQPGDGDIPAGPASTKLAVTAWIAGVQAEVLYAGAAPGLIAGVAQINVRVPAGLSPDLNAPVFLVVNGVQSPPATVSIQ